MSAPLFRLFVYGTLKRGGAYHERFCSGAVTIEPAETPGTLDRLPAGYPVLFVPATSQLADGTADLVADLRTQEREAPPKPALAPGALQAIHGEVIAFDDPARRLPVIDAFEDFRPRGRSLYRRILIPVRLARDGCSISAWAYVGNPR